MVNNLGGTERVIRVVLGIALVTVGAFGNLPGWGTGLAYVVGGIAMVTGVIGYCPAWRVLGINTCQTKTGP